MFWLLREVSFTICLYSGSGFFFLFWTILTSYSRTYGYQRTPLSLSSSFGVGGPAGILH